MIVSHKYGACLPRRLPIPMMSGRRTGMRRGQAPHKLGPILMQFSIIVLLCSCTPAVNNGGGIWISDSGVQVHTLKVGTRQEVDALYGKFIEVTGVLSNVDGQHAKVRMDSGLEFYLSHIDRQLPNFDWFKLVDKRVTVVGRLSAATDFLVTGTIPGPFLNNLKSLRPASK